MNQIYKYINIYTYIRRPLFRRCHQAAKQQCSSYRTFYVMTIYFPSLIADCLMFDWYTVRPKSGKSPPTWAVTWIPGSQQNNAPARTGVPSSPFWRPRATPGPRSSPWHFQGPPNEVQGHPQQPKWTSKGMPSTLQWQTNGQQLPIHRIIESSNHPIIGSSSLGAGGRGRSPSDMFTYIYIYAYIIFINIYIYMYIYIC